MNTSADQSVIHQYTNTSVLHRLYYLAHSTQMRHTQTPNGDLQWLWRKMITYLAVELHQPFQQRYPGPRSVPQTLPSHFEDVDKLGTMGHSCGKKETDQWENMSHQQKTDWDHRGQMSVTDVGTETNHRYCIE